MSLQDTPRANRLHIGLFGRRNAGKSSLLNALTKQGASLVSEVAGTTTDPVYKAMELPGVGAVVFIDTAGFDDTGALGEARVAKTRQAAEQTDLAVLLFPAEEMAAEKEWAAWFRARRTPVIAVVSRADERPDGGMALAARVREETGLTPLCISASSTCAPASGGATERHDLAELRRAILRAIPSEYDAVSVTGGLARSGDTVLLVMPQDIAAPKGRLILPQVQTIRDLLDRACVVVAVTADGFPAALAALKEPPALIVTDSQVFPEIWRQKPPKSRLTSFSVLFANYKGDIDYYTASAHAPLAEDIGRVKLPRALRKRLGDGITIEVVSGTDFPADLSPYDLIVHCGGCMFNRRYVMTRIAAARAQEKPMTNYGILLAKLAGILDKIDLPQAR